MSKLKILKSLIFYDLYRYSGKISFKTFLKYYFLTPGFNYSFWLRCSNSYPNNKFLKYYLYRKSIKFGIQIPTGVKIGKGFYIGHWGGIVVNTNVIIGDNCNISHNVTLGGAQRGKRKGTPIIGHHVYIGPGAKLIGKIHIGNNVAIGANAVVLSDIPDNSVVVGIPARVVSDHGSSGYINHILNKTND